MQKLEQRMHHEINLEYLKPTQFCDSDSNWIRRAAANLKGQYHTDKMVAKKAFEWVRDNIEYQLGLTAESASETLLKGAGSCIHKSNLLVAVLRTLGIPAGFHLMRVKTREYFGALCTPRFNQFMSEESLHVYCAAQINGTWVRIDPSDDMRFCNAINHLCYQATPVHFDGQTDARIQLNPDHVLADSHETIASVDHIFNKPRRVPKMVLEVFNLYLDFLRRKCIWYNRVEDIENDFFSWLETERPTLYSAYHGLAEQMGAMYGNRQKAAEPPTQGL